MKKDINKIQSLLVKDKTRNLIIIAGLLIVGLIFLSSFSQSKDKVAGDDFNTKDYQSALSSEILGMVTSVSGAGQAKIMLTLDNSYEYIYLDDGKTLQKINEPTVRGVVVVCEGADSPLVCADITELLTTALDIPSTKVCISKLN